MPNQTSHQNKIRSKLLHLLAYLLAGVVIMLFLVNMTYGLLVLPARWLLSILSPEMKGLAAFVFGCMFIYPIVYLVRVISTHKKTPMVLTIGAGVMLISIGVLIIYDQVYREYRAENNGKLFRTTTQQDDCAGLPQYCHQMASCGEAMLAFECGIYELDGDSDGVPCESLCK